MKKVRQPIAQTRTFAVWLALLVIFAAALAPTVTHAFFGSNARFAGAEICTSTGLQWVADVSVASKDNNAQKAAHLATAFAFEHCPFCLHQAGHVALPPHPFAYLFLDAGGMQVPLAWQAFFYAKDSRFWAPPRGPPAVL